MTCACVIEAMLATRGSSRLSTAVAVAGRSVTISDLARSTASGPPNSPTCASPTLSTMPTSGVTIEMSWAISPMALAPISTIWNFVSFVTLSISVGAPTLLLNEPNGATVAPSGSRMARSMFFVVVLPFEPVTATTRSSPRARTRATTSRASAPIATTPFATITWLTGRSSSRSAITTTAPASTAAGANRCPSVTSPGIAKKIDPGLTLRESVSTDPPTMVDRRVRAGEHETPVEHACEVSEFEVDHAHPASRSAACASSRALNGSFWPAISMVFS